MSYAHLSQGERYQIQCLKGGGFSLREIAVELNRHPSTISRELRRNATGAGGYQRKHAQRQSVLRRHAASAQPRIDVNCWAQVQARLVEDWSPDQIARAGEVTISHERIYQYIAADRQRGGTLWRHLRRRKRRRRHRCGTPRQRQRFGGRRIHERPPSVDQRRRVGDWEGDTIVGNGLARIVTLVDRKSGFARLQRVANGEADSVMRAILSVLYPLHARVHTLTWDNGSEFAEHRLIDFALEARSYFAMPYSSWQRGCNENFNGLLRQYVPKGCDISTFTDAQIQQIEDKLNRRPRKRLGYRTPERVFEQSFKRVALRS
ncbi:MAG: IS30 family transposase [Rhodanobacteraceae bacterium]